MASLRQLDFRNTYDLSYFNAFMAGRSYVSANTFSSADSDLWTQWQEQQVDFPFADRYPHAYRWFVHINALMRLKSSEPLVSRLTSGLGTIPTNDRKRRHSGESLSQLQIEASERASRRETMPILFTIQIAFRNINNDDDAKSQDSRKLWEKVKQTALPKEMKMKWGEFCTWMPSEKGDKYILQTTFVSRVSTTDKAMNGNSIVSFIFQSHPDDVEFCEIISQKAL